MGFAGKRLFGFLAEDACHRGVTHRALTFCHSTAVGLVCVDLAGEFALGLALHAVGLARVGLRHYGPPVLGRCLGHRPFVDDYLLAVAYNLRG